MTKAEIYPWFIAGYMTFYAIAVVGGLFLARWTRRTRWPFRDDDQLLRGPGEELKRRLATIDEDALLELFAGFAAPFFILLLAGPICLRLAGLTPAITGRIALVAIVIAAIGSAWRIVRLWRMRANHYLGWFGERVVGECLDPLKIQGWNIFHDMPCAAGDKKFNIDHIAVGPGGVFAIETKAKRKGHARPKYQDHVVFFDGRELEWPWGKNRKGDQDGLAQAERNADWLTDWIKSETGERIRASPVLVLPGWWVELKPTAEPRRAQVMNPKWLAGRLGKLPAVLDGRQIALVAGKLEKRCRDVKE